MHYCLLMVIMSCFIQFHTNSMPIRMYNHASCSHELFLSPLNAFLNSDAITSRCVASNVVAWLAEPRLTRLVKSVVPPATKMLLASIHNRKVSLALVPRARRNASQARQPAAAEPAVLSKSARVARGMTRVRAWRSMPSSSSALRVDAR